MAQYSKIFLMALKKQVARLWGRFESGTQRWSSGANNNPFLMGSKNDMDLSPIYSTGYKKRTEHVAEMKTQPGLLDLIL